MRVILTYIFSLILICSLLLAGCDSLNLNPRGEISSEEVWGDAGLTENYLDDVYASVGYGFGNPMPSAGLVDESVNDPVRQGGVNIMSTLTPSNRGDWELGGAPQAAYAWQNVYAQIRDINIFLENVEGRDVLSPSKKETLLGEAYFLRAYFYHNLMKKYGGVPIIEEPFELGQGTEQYQVPRNTFKETVDNIVADLDSAATLLSLDARRGGTATKGAALALKSRVLLHAASDLYNENPSGREVTGYTGGSQEARWQRAKEAAQAVIDLNEYSLLQAESSEEYRTNLLQEDNPEFIWARYFSEAGGPAHNQSLWTSPNGYDCWGGNMPTQQHVDAYEMTDGSQFEWEEADPVSADAPVDAKNPYENRDPRFNANIIHNGTNWRERQSGARALDPKGIMQTGWYEHPERGGSYANPGVQGELRPGLETRDGPIHPWAGSKTGYFLKKFLSREVSCLNEQAYNPWPFIRYAEVLLSYAEASANLGNAQDALWALNQVRSRVGMPDVPPDGGPERTLMERIRQEREVELAFEDHRYWDVRRWMIAPEAYQDAKRVRIVGHLDKEGELLVEHRYNYHYNVKVRQDRQWDDKNYFVPIPRGEMERNPELVQNPEY